MSQDTTTRPADASHADGHAALGHVVPVPLLFGVLGILLVLTFATVAITWFDLGSLNLVAALGIAVVKATFVLLYFMHLRWDKPFNAVVIVSSLVLVMLFVGFAMIDSIAYQPDVIPGYSPAMGQ